ncbi:transient receptor potential cation channel subfamily A member 1-like [Ostrea edulis]|uniref:transient receptor potential cation channel subfamily A member 1-like n=1 Tax=Ostrea edulis TaxID=37623 RepID=UPI0024AF38D2|nr:transient receptor potential cation channel subfamily A member 1-like [Ostrea edulis]
MGKEEELLKTIHNNDEKKLQKLLLPEKEFQIRKVDVPTSGTLGGRIRMQVVHVDINCQENGTGYTPLIISVLNGNKEIMETLLFYSASVNLADQKGNTPLHLAAFMGRLDLVYILLRNNAKVNIQNSDGNTPLHVLCQSRADDSLQLIHTLLRTDTDTTLINKNGESPLDVAAMYNRKDLVSCLMDSDVCMTGNTSAIIESAIRGHTDIVQLLLDFGVNPNCIDKDRKTCALHEATRFLRMKVAEELLKYGADPEKENSMKETPYSIASQLPSTKSADFMKLFEEYKGKGPTVMPKFLKVSSGKPNLEVKDYPLIETDPSWTKNSPDFCNACTANSPNTNLLDGNLRSFWVIPAVTEAWSVFDFHSAHTITGIFIYGWSNPQMIKTFELQTAEDVRGPWTTVNVFNCALKGSQNAKDPGVPQKFTGFTSTSQFWRINIISNHGGQCMCFQAVEFHGTDHQVTVFFEQLNLQKYTDAVIKVGYNNYRKFLLADETKLRELIEDESDFNTVIQELTRCKRKEFVLTTLKWEKPPVQHIDVGENLPNVVVKGDYGCTESVELFIKDGRKEPLSKSRVQLCSNGSTSPKYSTAVFKDVILDTVGTFELCVRGMEHPEIILPSPHTVEIKPKNKLTREVERSFQDLEDMLEGLQDL